MKQITLRNGSLEPWYEFRDTYIVPPVGSTVTYSGPAFGAEGTRNIRLARVVAIITSINRDYPASPPTVRLFSEEFGEGDADVSCQSLEETRRDETAILREREQLCAAWLAQHLAGQRDGVGKSFQPAMDEVLALPGVDKERIERIAATYKLTDKFLPWIPGVYPLQDQAMAAEGYHW